MAGEDPSVNSPRAEEEGEGEEVGEGSLLDVSRLSPVNAYRPIAGSTAETVGEAGAKPLSGASLDAVKPVLLEKEKAEARLKVRCGPLLGG